MLAKCSCWRVPLNKLKKKKKKKIKCQKNKIIKLILKIFYVNRIN